MSSQQAAWQQQLWNQYNEISDLLAMWRPELQQRCITPQLVQQKVMAFLTLFAQPGTGAPGTSTYVKGHFSRDDITPYMHALLNHVPQLMDRHGDIVHFGTAVTERTNGDDQHAYFTNTSRRPDSTMRELALRRYRILMNPHTPPPKMLMIWLVET